MIMCLAAHIFAGLILVGVARDLLFRSGDVNLTIQKMVGCVDEVLESGSDASVPSSRKLGDRAHNKAIGCVLNLFPGYADRGTAVIPSTNSRPDPCENWPVMLTSQCSQTASTWRTHELSKMVRPEASTTCAQSVWWKDIHSSGNSPSAPTAVKITPLGLART